MKSQSFLTWALFALGAVASAGALGQPLVLTNATLIDGTGAPPQPGMTIVMEQGRIRAIGRGLAPPAQAQVVDLAGKYVVPGIINAHGHVVPENRDAQLRTYAQFGVTTTTSMSVDPDDTLDFKRRQAAGDLRGARILSVMYRFTSPPMKPGSEYPTPELARAKVDEIVAKGADFVKVWVDAQGGRYPKLTPEYTAAVMDQARKHGKLTMSHIVELEDARRMVDQGVNMLVHGVRDQPLPDDFIATLKAKNVSVIPTLGREEAQFIYGEPGFAFDDPLLQKALSPERMNLLRTRMRETQAKDPDHAKWVRQFETDKLNLKKMVDAGIRYGFGTDSGGAADRFLVPGWLEHRNMALMRDAGLTPMQIIVAFSKNNSEMLGISKDFGTLAVGKAADLLVVPRNPLEDITRMRDIEAVYLGGRRFESLAAGAQQGPAYEVDATWPRPLPDDWITGQVGGVCVGRDDDIYIVNRRNITDEEKQTSTSAPSIIRFDRTGKVVASWGNETTVPGGIHGCTVDREGNVWVAGNADAIVQKYSPEGALLIQIGTRGKFDSATGAGSGKGLNSAPDRLYNPSGVAVDPDNGEVYVSDGYGNRRVAVFDRNGKFLRQWGRQATDDETRGGVAAAFSEVVHCIAMSNEGLLYVCDRQGDRIQVFRKDGTFVRNIPIPNRSGALPDKRGTAWWVAFSPDPAQKFLFMMNGGTEQVHILDHASGKILSSFGRPGHQAGSFTHGHTLAVDSQSNIYVAETDWGRRVQKFRLVKQP